MRCPICNLYIMQLKEKGKPTNTYWCLNCNKDITFFDDDTAIGHRWVAEDLHAKAERQRLLNKPRKEKMKT